jgi:hypothetical protein
VKTKTLLAISLATLLAAGCAHRPRTDETVGPGAGVPGIKCEKTHTVCHIAVRVRDCNVKVDPEWKHVARRPGGVRMLWTLQDSKGVRFSRNGIVFKHPDDEKNRVVFTLDREEVAWDTFAMHNTTAFGDYKYTVNVIDNGRTCKPLDPGVVNEM